MKLFHTRDTANEGVKIFLVDPRTGQETQYFLKVLGSDSDVFRAKRATILAEAVVQAAIVEAAKKRPGISEEQLTALAEESDKQQKLRLLAATVVEWNLVEEDGTTPTPLTEASIVDLFTKAPQIADAIDRIVGNRQIFFAHCSKASMNGQSGNSNSAGHQEKVQP